MFSGQYPKSRCNDAFFKTRESGDLPLHYTLLWWNHTQTPHNKCVSIYCQGQASCDECAGRCEGAVDPPGALGDYDNFFAHEDDYGNYTNWFAAYGTNVGIEWCPAESPPVTVSGGQ